MRWKGWLEAIPGVLVAERLKARREGGQVAGDLDVVAVDPRQRIGICFEIKWPIDAISMTEVLKIEDWVSSAADQTNRLRAELTSGSAAVDMPKGWPAFADITWTWAVATPQQLCLRPVPFDDIYATSFRYMASHGTPTSLNDVIETLISPDLPVEGVHFKIDTMEFRIGWEKVVIDAIGLIENGWKPQAWR